MLTSAEAYKRLLLKINKNDTNADIDISKGEFVILYNEQKDRWLKEQINKKESMIDIQDIEEVLVKRFSLTKIRDTVQFSVFEIPDNFFSYVSSYSICSKGKCKGAIVYNFPFKPKNENMLLEGANTMPSLEYEETIVDLSDNKLFVYRSDFDVDIVYLSYYRSVGAIDIAGYRRLDGIPSTNIDPDLSDVYVDEILNRCAKEIIRRYENPDGFQLADERVKTEEKG